MKLREGSLTALMCNAMSPAEAGYRRLSIRVTRVHTGAISSADASGHIASNYPFISLVTTTCFLEIKVTMYVKFSYVCRYFINVYRKTDRRSSTDDNVNFSIFCFSSSRGHLKRGIK